MALNSGKQNVWRNWELITMPNTVIACVNTLGSDQTKLLTFIYRHGRLIVDIENPGVGSNSDEVEVELLGVDSEIE